MAYTLHLAHASLSRITSARLLLAARSFAEKLSSVAPDALLPGETLIATVAPAPTSRLLRTQQAVKAFSGLIDDFRVFTRLWGLLKIWSWGAGLWKSPPEDQFIRAIVWAQVGTSLVFQYLENCAYLASKGVLALGEKRITRWYIWSARLWATYVFLDLVRLAREAALQRQEETLRGTEDEKGSKVQRLERATKWWRDVYANAAWMPLTIHWSMEGGLVGEGLIATLGLVPGILGLKDAWKASA